MYVWTALIAGMTLALNLEPIFILPFCSRSGDGPVDGSAGLGKKSL